MSETGKLVLVTGAAGKIGGILRRVWGETAPGVIWQGRQGAPSDWLRWDMLEAPYAGPGLEGGVILNLAGVTPGGPQDLEDNRALALAALRTAAAEAARHVFLVSSAAVYGPGPESSDLLETAPLHPANPYGLAKLEMEIEACRFLASLGPGAPGMTILRIGNVLGCDALIGRARPGAEVMLDPVPGQAGGPVRSYIGPQTLAQVLRRLCNLALAGTALPPILNIAAPGEVSMAALLQVAGQPWRFGPANPAVVPRVVLDTSTLSALVPLAPGCGTAESMVAEWRALETR